MDCDASGDGDSAADVSLSQADHLFDASFIALSQSTTPSNGGAGPTPSPADMDCDASVEEDRAVDVSRSQEDRLLHACFIGPSHGLSPCDGSVVPPPAPHVHSTAAPIANRPDGSPSSASPGLARLPKRAVAKAPVTRARGGGWLSWTQKKKVKVGANKTRGVHITSTETAVEAQQEQGNGDLRSCAGGEPPRPGEEGKTQQEDGNGDLGLGESGEQPRPGEKGETQQEGNGDLGLGKGGELPRADEEDETQPADLQTFPTTSAVGELIAILAADRLPEKLPACFVKRTPLEKKDESGRCSTEVPCGGVQPPRNLIEAINILAGEPSIRFADMDILDILKMKGIDLTLPQSNRRQDGAC